MRARHSVFAREAAGLKHASDSRTSIRSIRLIGCKIILPVLRAWWAMHGIEDTM